MKETALQLGEQADLVGVLTMPDVPAGQAPRTVVLLLNAGLLHRVGPHRLYVELARRLAGEGVATLRVDLAGIGDSGPRRDRLRGREAVVQEAGDAITEALAHTGAREVVVGGLCAGADHAYHVALADERVTGLLWIDGFPFRTRGWYLRHYSKRMLRRQSWINVLTGKHPVWGRLRREVELRLGRGAARSSGNGGDTGSDGLGEVAVQSQLDLRGIPPRAEVEAGLGRLLARGVTLYAVYTAGLLQYLNGIEQFGEMYPSLAGHPRVRLAYLEQADHTCTLRNSRERVVETLAGWLPLGLYSARG